jgi:outer membrane protein assembly factor BamB
MTSTSRTRLLALAVVLGLATGCSTIKGWLGSSKSEALEPAELTEIVSPLPVRSIWTVSLGDEQARMGLRQHPAIEGDRVFAADDSGRVSAFSLATGDRLWQTDALADASMRGSRWAFWRTRSSESGLTGSPAAGNGMVVIGGRNGEVVALDAGTGAKRWAVTVTSEVQAAPLITAERIVVRAGDGRVFGLDPADGSRKWVFDRGLPSLSVRGSGTPVAGQGVIYVGYDDGSVVMLRLEDGARGWEQIVAEPTGRTELDRMADVDGEIQVGLQEVYATSFHGQTMAMAADNGRPLWNRDIGSYAGIALLGDRLLVSDKDGTLWALDRNTGSALWKQDAFARRWLTTPVVHGDYAVVGDVEGYLHWIKLDSGEIAGRDRIENAVIRATPQVSSDGVLVAATVEGKLAAYRVAQ